MFAVILRNLNREPYIIKFSQFLRLSYQSSLLTH